MKEDNYNTITNNDKEQFETNVSCLEITEQTRLTIDDILDSIGYTKYHIMMIVIIGLSLLSDGVEIYLIYLVSPILKEKYQLTENITSLITSALFMGIAIGSISSGIIIQKYQRRRTFLCFLSIISVFGTLCVVIENIWWFLVCRLLIGVSVGVLFNFPNALREILPKKYRDFLMGSIYIYVKLGIIFFVFIFFLFSHHPKENLNYIIIFSSIPMYFCLILAYFFYRESPRILFTKGEFEKGWTELTEIAQGSTFQLNDKHKYALLKSINEGKNDLHLNENSNFFQILASLFSARNIRLFSLLALIWISNVLIIFTNYNSLPKILIITTPGNTSNLPHQQNNFSLNDSNKIMKDLFIANLIPIPGEILAGVLTSMPLFGRKNTIILGFFIGCVSSVLMFSNQNNLSFYSSLISLSNILSFNIAKLYTVEAFYTNERDIAYGFINFSSRVASVFVPYIVNIALAFTTFGPCYFIAVICLFGIFASYLLPFDTFNKPLDNDDTVNSKK
jgi:MFS family permease